MNICYLRKSTKLGQMNSLDTQKKMVKDYCSFNGIELDEIIVDDGISGSKTKDRLGYCKVIDLIKQGVVDKVIVLSLSRWSRSSLETLKSIDLMKEHNTEFVSLKENVDSSTPMGKCILGIFGSLYQMELENLRIRTKDTLRFKKESGKVYGNVPYGFDRVGDDLVENPKEKRLINKMRKLKVEGLSYNQISEYLKRNRHKTKKGGVWNKSNVYSVMKNHINI